MNPVITEEYGCTIKRWRNAAGQLHNDYGPAREEWENGQLVCRIYCIDELYHRTDGPAYEDWQFGQYIKEYYFNGERIPDDEIFRVESAWFPL